MSQEILFRRMPVWVGFWYCMWKGPGMHPKVAVCREVNPQVAHTTFKKKNSHTKSSDLRLPLKTQIWALRAHFPGRPGAGTRLSPWQACAPTTHAHKAAFCTSHAVLGTWQAWSCPFPPFQLEEPTFGALDFTGSF